jgi:hypothetical protein
VSNVAFWVFRDATNEKSDGGVYLHSALCPRCNHGEGAKRRRTAPSITAVYYRGEPRAWIGPFETPVAADEFTVETWNRKARRHAECFPGASG